MKAAQMTAGFNNCFALSSSANWSWTNRLYSFSHTFNIVYYHHWSLQRKLDPYGLLSLTDDFTALRFRRLSCLPAICHLASTSSDRLSKIARWGGQRRRRAANVICKPAGEFPSMKIKALWKNASFRLSCPSEARCRASSSPDTNSVQLPRT